MGRACGEPNEIERVEPHWGAVERITVRTRTWEVRPPDAPAAGGETARMSTTFSCYPTPPCKKAYNIGKVGVAGSGGTGSASTRCTRGWGEPFNDPQVMVNSGYVCLSAARH